jgi:hypothetical protein
MAGDRCPRPLYPCCAAGGDERRFVKGGSIPERSRIWCGRLPAPVRACYEAGSTGYGLYRVAVALNQAPTLDLTPAGSLAAPS